MQVKSKPSFEFMQNMKNNTKMVPKSKGSSIELLHIFAIGMSQMIMKWRSLKKPYADQFSKFIICPLILFLPLMLV